MSIKIRTMSCAVVGLTVFLALLTSCSAAHAPAASQRLAGMNDANTLDVAEYVLLRDCMRELGFDYIVVDPRSLPQSRDFPYVINDVAWARQHGYGTDIELAQNQARQHDPNDKYMQSLSQSVGLRSW